MFHLRCVCARHTPSPLHTYAYLHSLSVTWWPCRCCGGGTSVFGTPCHAVSATSHWRPHQFPRRQPILTCASAVLDEFLLHHLLHDCGRQPAVLLGINSSLQVEQHFRHGTTTEAFRLSRHVQQHVIGDVLNNDGRGAGTAAAAPALRLLGRRPQRRHTIPTRRRCVAALLCRRLAHLFKMPHSRRNASTPRG